MFVAAGPQVPVQAAVVDVDADDAGVVADVVEAALKPAAVVFGVEVEGAERSEGDVAGEDLFAARVADLGLEAEAVRPPDDAVTSRVRSRLPCVSMNTWPARIAARIAGCESSAAWTTVVG